MNGFTFRLSGVQECKLAITAVGNNLNKAGREFVTKAGRLERQAIKSQITSQDLLFTRALYQSIDLKIPNLGKRNYYVSIAGPNKTAKLLIRMRKTGKYANQPLYAIPYKYAHLAERGTVERYTSTGAYRGSMPAYHQTEKAETATRSMVTLLASQVFKKYAKP